MAWLNDATQRNLNNDFTSTLPFSNNNNILSHAVILSVNPLKTFVFIRTS